LSAPPHAYNKPFDHSLLVFAIGDVVSELLEHIFLAILVKLQRLVDGDIRAIL
jgi:hypothetical protein